MSSLCVTVNTHHQTFSNAIIGGFTAPLHDGPAFGTVFPKYSVSLDETHIYELLKAYILPQGFRMMQGSKIIQLKSDVCIHFGNDTLPPLRSKVHQSSHLQSVVESDKSKQATPITFDWTGIYYPKKWEVRYQELRNVDSIQHTLRNKPLIFDRHTNSFRLPEQTPAPKFSPPLIRSSSVSSRNQRPKDSSSSSLSESPSTSYAVPHEAEHQGQHTECQACRKIQQRIQHHKQSQHPSLGMFSLPRQNKAYEAIV